MAGLGVNSFIQIKKETTWGTAVTSGFWLLPMIEEGIALEVEPIESEYIQSGAAKPDPAQGGKLIRGTLTMPLTYGRIDHMLQGVFGTFTESTPTGGTTSRDHWAELNTTLPSYTVELCRGNIEAANKVFIYEGMKITSLNISVPEKGPGRIVATFIGQTESGANGGSTYSSASQVAVSVQEVLASHLQAGYDIGPNAASGTWCIKSMDLTVDRKLEPRFCLGDAQTKEPLATDFADVTGSFQVDFDDWHVYESFRDFTFETTGTLTFQHGTAIEGALFPQLVFELNRIKYNSPSQPFVNTRGILSANCPWEGFGNSGTAAAGTPDEVSSKEPIAIKTRNTNVAANL